MKMEKATILLIKVIGAILIALILYYTLPGSGDRIRAEGQAFATVIDSLARASAVFAMSCVGGLAGLIGLFLPLWLIVNRSKND